MTDEEKLLSKLKQGDERALEKAISVYTPYLSTVLFNLAGSRLSAEDSEEIIADVFIALWRNACRIDLQKGTVRSYIAAAARNSALKRLNMTHDCAALEDAELEDKNSLADGHLLNELVWESVMALGEPDSEIFVRYYKYGQKLNEIAKATDLTLSTVKTKLSRGKQKLKKTLKNTEGLL